MVLMPFPQGNRTRLFCTTESTELGFFLANLLLIRCSKQKSQTLICR